MEIENIFLKFSYDYVGSFGNFLIALKKSFYLFVVFWNDAIKDHSSSLSPNYLHKISISLCKTFGNNLHINEEICHPLKI